MRATNRPIDNQISLLDTPRRCENRCAWALVACAIGPSRSSLMWAAEPTMVSAKRMRHVAKSLSVEKHSIKLAPLITALFYDLAQDKLVQIPKQGERREREYIQCVSTGNKTGPESILTAEAIDMPATKLRTPLQVQLHLALILEAG